MGFGVFSGSSFSEYLFRSPLETMEDVAYMRASCLELSTGSP